MTLREYKKRLDKHDWYYPMSDDPRWYDAGLTEENELRKLAQTKPSFAKAFEDKRDSIFKKLSDGKR